MTDEEFQPLSEILPEVGDDLHSVPVSGADLEVRSTEERIIGARIVAWDTPADTPIGIESYQRGAFAHIDPHKVVLRLEHTDPPAGKGLTLEERSDGAYMTFKISKTLRGDEILTLAADGVTPGVSLSYHPAKTMARIGYRDGKRSVHIGKADLREVSTTWRPMHERTDVLFVRSQPEPETKEIPVSEAPVQPEPQAPVIDLGPLAEVLKNQTDLQQRSFDAIVDRIGKLEESNRGDIVVPGPVSPKKATLGEWASVAVRLLKGSPVSKSELQQRALDDIITPDNPGLVPDALRTDLLIGIVNNRRPFLNSTTQVDAPETGMSIVVPVITQHSTAAVQTTEKTEVESTALKVTTQDFPSKAIFGAADVSIQMLRRADRSFMSLLMRDLGRAYARNGDAQAIATLFAAGTTDGGANIDPENLTIGEAWENSMTATEEPPDTIWLSAKGVSAFINAKSDGTNSPLYFTLNAAFRVGTGPGGDVSALRPVYVPALDTTGVDVMIGPSSGFAWAEDAPIELQADNPTLAGRDIALGGILFFIPRYPAAFTTYDLGS
jgi:phage head maturation protease